MKHFPHKIGDHVGVWLAEDRQKPTPCKIMGIASTQAGVRNVEVEVVATGRPFRVHPAAIATGKTREVEVSREAYVSPYTGNRYTGD